MIHFENCKDGVIYSGQGRNFKIALFSTEKKGFLGIREKFGCEYVDRELHYESDDRFGTFTPETEIGTFVLDLKHENWENALFIKLKEIEGKELSATELVDLERYRQRIAEGRTLDSDLVHPAGTLSLASVCYLLNKTGNNAIEGLLHVGKYNGQELGKVMWPWSVEDDKRDKHDRKRSLVVGIALAFAELEKLIKEEGKQNG